METLPVVDVLPLKRSQDATIKRRLVYLDQMVVSNMAKAALEREMAPEQRASLDRLRNALKVAVREKQNARLLESHFHRDESSGIVIGRPDEQSARVLFAEIARFVQYYSFGLQISPRTELMEMQTLWLAARQLNLKIPPRQYLYRNVLSRDPQEPNEEGPVIRIGSSLAVIGIEWQPRILDVEPSWPNAASEMRAKGEFPDYETTLMRVERECREAIIRDNEWHSWANRYRNSGNHANAMPRGAMDQLIASNALFCVPYLFVYSRLYAHVLSETKRPYKAGDRNDIGILASVIPYCDLVITDSYMAAAVKSRQLDRPFSTKVLAATNAGLEEAARYILE